jgi:serine/threonine protein kinase
MLSALPPPTAEEQRPYKDLTGEVKCQDHYFAYGGFAEVFRGEWRDSLTGGVRPVAIKLLRGVHTDELVKEAIIRRLNRETRVWHALSHENILPFFGVCDDLGPSFAMVSPFCANGSVLLYLTKNPQVDRLAIIIGVACGLQYLHSQNVIHGDIKGHNVLVGDNGIPLLADVGRSKFIDHGGFTTSFSGSARYLAPELVADEPDIDDSVCAYEAIEFQLPQANLTKETDIYAFSMVAIEILTEQIPYFYLRQDSTVIWLVQEGLRPDRVACLPTIFTNTMWELLVDCWKKDPKDRPDIGVILQRLEMF